VNEERWRELTHWPMLLASLFFIVAYSWQVIADLQGIAELIARTLILVTWTVFLVDYLVRLWLAERRGWWFRHHVFDLFVVLLPALKVLRLLQSVTFVGKRSSAGTALRSRIGVYGAGAAIVLVWLGALGVLDAERGAPGANIETFGEAVWWAFVTITTVGYGDYYPVTLGGRFVAVAMMAVGVGLVGVVTATFSSWVLEKAAARTGDDGQPATRQQVRDVSRQLTEISSRLGGSPPG
jgi:voltage-gated potassium channel